MATLQTPRGVNWKSLTETPADDTCHVFGIDLIYRHRPGDRFRVECVYVQAPDGLWRIIRNPHNASGWTRPHSVTGYISAV